MDIKHQTKMKYWTFEPVIEVSFPQYPFYRVNLLHLTVLFISAMPPVTCRWMSKPYHDGDSFPAGDGCNTCTCNGGAVSCTAKLSCPLVG